LNPRYTQHFNNSEDRYDYSYPIIEFTQHSQCHTEKIQQKTRKKLKEIVLIISTSVQNMQKRWTVSSPSKFGKPVTSASKSFTFATMTGNAIITCQL
jgi:hypothetical protein